MLLAEVISPWSYLGYAALVASGFFVLFGARANQSKKDMAQSIGALQGSLDARKDDVDRLESENAKTLALNKSLESQVTDLRASVRTLERVVTGVDAINELSGVVKAGFVALNVPPEKLVVVK